jgi:hypothetical protein
VYPLELMAFRCGAGKYGYVCRSGFASLDGEDMSNTNIIIRIRINK